MPSNANNLYALLAFVAERVVYPALLILMTHWVGKKSQANQMATRQKMQEYSELLDILLERKKDILFRKSGPVIEAVDQHEEAERAQRFLAVGKTFQDRLFIDRALKKIDALERWNSIERLASDHRSSYVDCQTKLNHLIEEIRKQAQNDVR